MQMQETKAQTPVYARWKPALVAHLQGQFVEKAGNTWRLRQADYSLRPGTSRRDSLVEGKELFGILLVLLRTVVAAAARVLAVIILGTALVVTGAALVILLVVTVFVIARSAEREGVRARLEGERTHCVPLVVEVVELIGDIVGWV